MQQAVWASLWVLRFGGLWPPQLGGAWRQLFAVYSGLVLVFSVGGVGSCGVSLQSYADVVGEVTPTIGNIIMLTAGIGKSIALLTRQQKFRRLLRLLDELVVSQAAQAREAEETLCAARRTASRLTLGLVGYVFLIFMLWAALPLVRRGPDKQLPFCHIRALASPAYEAHFCVQFASTFYWIWLSVGVDCFFASVMTHITAQFELLNRRLACLGHPAPADVTELRQAAPAEDKVQRGLVQCVQSHQRILSFVNHFQEAVGPVALIQFAASVTVVCMTLCISTFSAAVSLSAYSSAWVHGGRSARSGLLLTMTRAARPCELSAAGFCAMDRGASVSLLNASYSFYALFRQVNNR